MEQLAQRPLDAVEFVAFDLETTGLSPAYCRIVEFGALRFRFDGTELGQFEQLCDPRCSIPYAAMRVHHITEQMVRGQPTVERVLPRFLEFLGGPETVLLAHHAPFDVGFLRQAVEECGLNFPARPVLDTRPLARACLGRSYGCGLETLGRAFRLIDCESHRALADSRLLAGVLRALVALRPDVHTVEALAKLAKPVALASPAATAGAAPHAERLQLAVRERQTLLILYNGTTGCGPRRVTARRLVRSAGHDYLAAFCHTEQIEKRYRLDRIVEISVESETG